MLISDFSIEDNDDLMNMLDDATPKLRERYGSYYIAEIVDKKSTRDIIVAEVYAPMNNRRQNHYIICLQHNNDPIGMMSFNTSVCLDTLTNNFDINTYFGLRLFENRTLSKTDTMARSDGYLLLLRKALNEITI